MPSTRALTSGLAATAFAALALVWFAPSASAQEMERSIEDGGIHVDGWMGAVDAGAAESGASPADARLAMEDGGYHVTTGPAVTYWTPSNTAAGDYTVRATFTEPDYMSLNDHPHPYGIVIGGNRMGTDQASYLYCAAYGNGNFIVRGFGPEPFQMNGRRGGSNPAVHEAAGKGEAVTQEIALSVRGGRVECAINGSVVASYDRSEVVTPGKLSSTDGVYGFRFGHNTEAVVRGLTVERH